MKAKTLIVAAGMLLSATSATLAQGYIYYGVPYVSVVYDYAPGYGANYYVPGYGGASYYGYGYHESERGGPGPRVGSGQGMGVGSQR